MKEITQKENKKFAKERIFRKTIEIIEKPFTTEPKTYRRKNRVWISGNRAKAFMKHLWKSDFAECNYKALRLKFIVFFGTNEERVIQKYIGCPKQTVQYPGVSVVRLNRQSGTVAHFSYSNQRTVNEKEGLMETLGYISLDKKTGMVKIHHECMSYYTQQIKLISPQPPLLKNNECVSKNVAIEDLCVCPIEATESKRHHVVNGSIEVEKKEEEVIDYTHKSSLDFLVTKSLTNVKSGSNVKNHNTSNVASSEESNCGSTVREVDSHG